MHISMYWSRLSNFSGYIVFLAELRRVMCWGVVGTCRCLFPGSVKPELKRRCFLQVLLVGTVVLGGSGKPGMGDVLVPACQVTPSLCSWRPAR